MGSQEVLQVSACIDAMSTSCNGGILVQSENVEESENLGAYILNDLDLYWQDIADRLTVSRMVNDSVIKGMICAIQQEAAEQIAKKELELDELKESFHLKNVHNFMEYDRLQGSLGNLKFASNEQFKKLNKEIDKIRGVDSIGKKCLSAICFSAIEKKGSSLIGRKGSSSELLGLSGMDKLIDVDRALDGLRKTLESIFSQTKDMLCMSKSLVLGWLHEREFQAEIEEMVIKNCIQSLREEFEQKLWDQNAQSYGFKSTNQLENIKEISMLRQELDAISKTLCVPESGHLVSHGSLEHCKVSCSHASSPSLWEGNGKHDESVSGVPDSLEHSQLKHMTKEELFNYLKAEMSKMKRSYELKEHEMIEENFSLKREYLKLKERHSSFPVVKEMELDTLKKKIPEIILKLDSILMENETLPSFSNNGVCLDNMKGRLESLRSENHQLRDLLMDRKKEIKCLSSQVSVAEEKITAHSLAEENLSRMYKDLKCAMEDAEIEASISEDLYKFLLKEVVEQMKGFNEQLDMEYEILQGIYQSILNEAAYNDENSGNLEIEDSVIESTIAQGIYEVIFKESLKEAEEKICTMNLKYINENEIRVSLQMQTLEKEKLLRLNTAEKEKAEQEVLLLRDKIDEKADLVQEAVDALAKEKARFKLASQELEELRGLTAQQNEELQVGKGDLVKAWETVETAQAEISNLKEEKTKFISISQEQHKNVSLVEARDREQGKQMNYTIELVQALSKEVSNFEHRATEFIFMNSSRLENLCSQLSSLMHQANTLKRMEFMYKQRLERRSSDLQKAEAEVDLLGDEVDVLHSLLEKIYIALDHYSPILKHYPGIMEILKLVRRELSGESVKPV